MTFTMPAFITPSPALTLSSAHSTFRCRLQPRRPFGTHRAARTLQSRTVFVMASASEHANKNKKKICVLADGTWDTPERDETTNIVKLACAINAQDEKGTNQVMMYDSGVGTTGSDLKKQLDGVVGAGIDANIKQLYTFLSLNYTPGDEIYLFGFSRGAYTVRSLTGLMYHAGLVRGDQLEWVQEAYDLYRSEELPDGNAATDFRRKHGERAPVKLLSCFDTVGALGLPDNLDILNLDEGKYEFHDTTVNHTIENAIHMLSIEEDKTTFLPTLMKHAEGRPDQLTQHFFWGNHSGVGGGNARERVCSSITMEFLLQEMRRRGLHLGLNEDVLPKDRDIMTVLPPAEESRFDRVVKRFTGKSVRTIPSVDWLHETAILRYQLVEDWRPEAMQPLHDAILAKKVNASLWA